MSIILCKACCSDLFVFFGTLYVGHAVELITNNLYKLNLCSQKLHNTTWTMLPIQLLDSLILIQLSNNNKSLVVYSRLLWLLENIAAIRGTVLLTSANWEVNYRNETLYLPPLFWEKNMNNSGDTYCYLLDSAGSRCLLGQGGLVKLVSYKKHKLYS